MLDNLPDHIVLEIFSNLTLRDRLNVEMVSVRFHNLMQTIWNRKRQVIIPDDLRNIDQKFTFSSYWTDFGNGMTSLIRHCPNLNKLYFKKFRRLQIFIQESSFNIFAGFTNNELTITEIHFGKLFVADKHCFEVMATIFPLLTKLTIEEPYPIIYPMKADTMPFLKTKIKNLQPGLDFLLEENNRIMEDLRYLLCTFPRLEKLRIKDIVFEIIV